MPDEVRNRTGLGYFAECDTEEDEPLNQKKGNDWVASIVSGLIVGGMLAGTNYLLGKGKDDSATLVNVQNGLAVVSTEVKFLSASVKTLTEQPYVRRDEYGERIDTIEGRLSGLEKRVDSFEHSAGRDGR